MSRSGFDQPGRPEIPVPLTVFDRLTTTSFRIFRSPARSIAKAIPGLRESLLKSDISVTPEGLVSVALFLTLATGIAVIAIVTLSVAILGFNAAAFLLLAIPIVPMIVLNAPGYSAASRASRLENELPFVVGFMSIIAGGGQSLVQILKRISTMNIFPGASKEAYRLLVDVEVYGEEPVNALESASRYNPNKWYSELLSGYATVLRTGGDNINYLAIKLKEVFDERAARIKRASEITGAIAEIYLIVTVVLGIIVFTLYIVQSLVAGDVSGLTNIFTFAFVVVPLVSGVFIFVLDGTQPKWPFTDTRPYKIFAITLPFGVALYLLPLPIRVYLHLSLALIVLALPAAIFATKYSADRRGIEKALPDFIRDVAEGRKIGLAPEASVERLVGRNYGALSRPVSKMGSQLTWGLSLKKVLTAFVVRVNSWIARAVGTLMLEVVVVGGGTVKSFSDMADFTKRVNTMELETRAALRGYTFIAYISGIMIISTTYIFIYFLGQGAASGLASSATQFQVDPETVDLLFAAAVFESWVIGIVAGKMGEASIAEGFKHAVVMVLLTLATVAIAQTLFPIPV
ncbi:MAG: type II secretion system F family protein [archaeon]|nr:MAG: type II secretion system F family protein [archaeon]